MAGQKDGVFKELLSPFLKRKLAELEADFGTDSPQYLGIARQYLRSDMEDRVDEARQRRRHYEADMSGEEHGLHLHGVERLYRRSVVIEPTTYCLAHCRWCLRGRYEVRSLTMPEVMTVLDYLKGEAELREILITGGDPMVVAPLLEFMLDKIETHVPQIEIVRIGTRILTQEPKRLDDRVLAMLGKKRRYRTEVGMHVCHPVEFWPETEEKVKSLLDIGVRLYNQHPLLKGVNDDLDTLRELYDRMRHLNIEPHYLFHCVPMRGMDHHRTTIQKGLELIRRLDSGGYFSGRSKPHYTAMTDIGKIPFYHGTILDRDEHNNVLLRSGYLYEERTRWNPSWRKPDSCVVDDEGILNVWYPDGCDD